MSLLDNIKKKAPADLVAQLQDALGDDFDWDYVPRARLNDVITQRNELRRQVASFSSGDDGDGKPDTTPKDGAKPQGLTQKDVDAAVQAAIAAEQKKFDEFKLQSAITEKLREAKVKSPELLLPKIKMEKIKLDDMTDLETQLTTLKTSYPFMFGDSKGDGATGTGVTGKASDQEPETLQQQYDAAIKSGNLPLAVSIKNQMFNIKKE